MTEADRLPGVVMRRVNIWLEAKEDQLVDIRGAAFAAGMVLGALCSGTAFAAPVSSGGGVASNPGVELAQWNRSPPRHVAPRHGRCWWENRRVGDHRGRWVVRRVQVCRR